MARDVQSFSVTVNPGGMPAAPQRFSMTMPARIVTRVTLFIPPGPRGELGIALGAAGVQYLPSNVGGYIVADNQVVPWDLEDVIESGAWQLVAYNTGLYPHTVQVVFECELPQVLGPLPEAAPGPAVAQSSLIGTTVQ